MCALFCFMSSYNRYILYCLSVFAYLTVSLAYELIFLEADITFHYSFSYCILAGLCQLVAFMYVSSVTAHKPSPGTAPTVAPSSSSQSKCDINNINKCYYYYRIITIFTCYCNCYYNFSYR